MRASLLLLVTTLGLTPISAASHWQAETTPIQILVEAPRGRTVNADSIDITVDGERRRIVSVAAASEPQNLLVAIDASDFAMVQSFSTYDGRDYRSRLAKALEGDFLRKLRPEDRVRLGSFGSSLRLSSAFTAHRQAGAADATAALQLPESDRRGMQPIWDIVIEATAVLAAQPGPKALILYSTGEATGNAYSLDDAIAAAQRRGVPVHVVSAAIDLIIPQTRTTANKRIAVTSLLYSRPSAGLRELAAATGGVFVQAPGSDRPYRAQFGEDHNEFLLKHRTHNVPPRWDNPGKGFSEVAARLVATSLVSIETSGLKPGLHNLEVRPTTPDVRVHAPSRVFVHE